MVDTPRPSVDDKVKLIQSRLHWCGHDIQLLFRGRHRCAICGVTKPAKQFGYWLLQRCDANTSELDGPAIPVPICRVAQAAALPIGLNWNGHRIVNSAPGFKCLLCGQLREDLSFGICTVESDLEASDTVIQGSLADFLKACKERRTSQMRARAQVRQTEAVALAVCSLAAPSTGPVHVQPP